MWQADPEKSPKDSARPKGTHWFHGQSADGAECVHEAAAIPWLACRSGFPRVTWDWGAVVAKETRCILWCQTWLAGKSPKNQGFRGKSSNEMVGFPSPLFVYSRLPPPAPPAACLTHNLLTHTTCPHTTYSHTHNLLTHNLSTHTTYSHTHTTCPHTTCPHKTCPHTTYSHTTCPHTTCPHTAYSHTTCPHTIYSHTHTQLPHTHNLSTHTTYSHTTCPHTTCPHTTCPHTTYSHTTYSHTTWRHGPSLCVAGVALVALGWLWWRAWFPWTPLSPRLFAWQAWHLATSTCTWRGRRGTWRHPAPLCVAGVALGDIDLHFAG